MTFHDRAEDSSETAPYIVRMREVSRKVNLSESHLYLLISQGKFPRPFPLVPGGRSVGWIESDITGWMLSRKAASKGGAQ